MFEQKRDFREGALMSSPSPAEHKKEQGNSLFKSGHFEGTLLLLLLSSIACNAVELLPYDAVADPRAVVTSGCCARFTVLKESVVRMEWEGTGVWEDRPSLAVLNRRSDVLPHFVVSTSAKGVLSIDTSTMKVEYAVGSTFSGVTLNVTLFNGITYHFGDVDHGNMLGTIRSLDNLADISLNCSTIAGKQVHGESLHCRYGVLSRGGWTTIDDSQSFMLDAKGEWYDSPNVDTVDTYFFGHGTDYRGALRDYRFLSGAIPLIPRGAFGIMWSRWFDYSGIDTWQLVKDYESRALPLDALILGWLELCVVCCVMFFFYFP